MLQLIQPVASALIGFALSIYGLFHAATYYPANHGLIEFWQMLPALSRLGLFLVGITAVIVGLVLLCTGIYASRRRYRQLRHLFGQRHDPRIDPRNDPRNYPVNYPGDPDDDYPPYYHASHARY